jgi:hypothetical protein
MPLEYQTDGDTGFIGLNSRDNPASLPKGAVSKSQNFRFDRGVATVRKGLERKTSSNILGQVIYGVGTMLSLSGQEIFVLVVTDGLFTYNPSTEITSTKVSFPAGETITTQDGCDVVCAGSTAFLYISRGHTKRPLIGTVNANFDSIASIAVAPSSGVGSQFPNCSGLLYYANRLIAIGQHHSHTYTPTARSRDSVGVSNYLDFDNWDLVDEFTFNSGSNDEVVAISPWTLTEFTVFMRNSIYYVNIGTGRYLTGEGLSSTTASMKIVVSDIGCIAKKSVVLANGGIIFLSDNGVYAMDATQVGSNESMRLLTNAEPLSKNIDDVIKTINKNYVHRSVGIYWNNRYYLAVPTGTSVDNNTVLVYNFILKNWESVDTYPAGFDVFDFQIAKKDNQRKLYGFDTDQGMFIFEELEYDEYGASNAGTPRIGFFKLDEATGSNISADAFQPNQINGQLDTRLYTFDRLREKRFSTVEADMLTEIGSGINTYAETINQDSNTLIDTFNSPSAEDFTRRNPIRKMAYGLKLKFITNYLRTSIRSVSVTSTVLGKQNISKK